MPYLPFTSHRTRAIASRGAFGHSQRRNPTLRSIWRKTGSRVKSSSCLIAQPCPLSATTWSQSSRARWYSSTTDSSRFKLLSGHALFAKRPSRPFPPPFLSHPTHSFSDPLSTHNRALDKRADPSYQGLPIHGVTNGDDAILAEGRLIAVADGVGAWAQKERGHAALWSRLLLHFWALAVDADCNSTLAHSNLDTQTEAMNKELDMFKNCLHTAYQQTLTATSPPNEIYGTTTATGAMLSCNSSTLQPVIHVTQLGDSAVLVIRPTESAEKALLYKTEEQWHWFDCPRQLGTNSPDTPEQNAVSDSVEVQDGDVVLAISDGVSDNLWTHEVVENVCNSIKANQQTLQVHEGFREENATKTMHDIAGELVRAARVIAEDPFAESPFMERAVEEGLPTEGGKLDDISVAVGIVRPRPESEG